MQIRRVGYGVRGFWKITDYAIRYARMVTEEAKKRAKILSFWKEYGLGATKRAFGVSRRSLYRWQKKSKEGQGKMEALNAASKRPKQTRKKTWHPDIVQEVKRIREAHPNLGKDKVHILLKPFCIREKLTRPSVSTIGRMIAADPKKMRTFPTKVRHNGTIVVKKRQKKDRKPKGFIAERPGHCLAFDTIERIVHGCRRYVVTMTDLYSRFSLAFCTTSHGSAAATLFFRSIRETFPYRIEHILTDNGSEFMKDFDLELRRLCLSHWHTYPKNPKMNAHDERFNRSIQEEFIDFHDHLLLDPVAFNDKMVDYLIWFNTERPHWALDLKSPIQFLIEGKPKECQMYGTDT